MDIKTEVKKNISTLRLGIKTILNSDVPYDQMMCALNELEFTLSTLLSKVKERESEYNMAESGSPEWICTENIEEACGDACIIKADEPPICCPFWTNKNMKEANFVGYSPPQADTIPEDGK